MFSKEYLYRFKAYDLFKVFPFYKLLKVLFGLALATQIAIILYNNYTGFYTVESVQVFLLRLIKGTFLSFLVFFFITMLNIGVIHYLNQVLEWQYHPIKRASIQLVFTTLIAAAVSIPITLVVHWLTPYPMGVQIILVYNVTIFAVTNIATMILLEAWYYFLESSKAKRKAAKLENELAQIRFEVLKNQMNPHFIFNNLEVLSDLIERDIEKSQQFIDEFAQLYRYVLESIEKPVVSLNDELSFVRSYMFLQHINYGNSLQFNIDLSSESIRDFLPPLALHTVLENAIKHNDFNETNPLKIVLYTENDWLIIENNRPSTVLKNPKDGKGIKNLSKQYSMVSSVLPKFQLSTENYKAYLPLIKEFNHVDEPF